MLKPAKYVILHMLAGELTQEMYELDFNKWYNWDVIYNIKGGKQNNLDNSEYSATITYNRSSIYCIYKPLVHILQRFDPDLSWTLLDCHPPSREMTSGSCDPAPAYCGFNADARNFRRSGVGLREKK